MRSVMRHEFSQTPTGNVPRSRFDRSHGHKTTFDFDYLIPVMLDEALPGDIMRLRTACIARLATPLFPVMDNAYIDLHCWSIPWRLIWNNFKKFLGEQVDPGDSIDYTIPVLSPSTAVDTGHLGDYFGLPLGLVPSTTSVSCLPFRAYRFTYNEHYRDQNLIDSVDVVFDDGPDNNLETGYASVPLKRGKRFDYFTQALPWPQKGDAVSLPLGTNAPIYVGTVGSEPTVATAAGITTPSQFHFLDANLSTVDVGAQDSGASGKPMYADLSSATSQTINQLRQSLAIQQFLELAARAGTRFAEIIEGFFGVEFQDVRYRPEYLGGGTFPINITPIANTSDTASYEQGELAGFGLAAGSGIGFTKAFDEWCYILVLASARCDLTYQQGLDKMWTRSTRYDLYWKQFAHIGEQSLLRQEIYHDAAGTGNSDVFGYVPRYDEYRWKKSLITGLFRSDATGTLEAWHWSQDFATAPTLNQTFIENAAPIDRTIAVPTEPHLIADFYFDYKCVRPMPIHGIPGLTRL